MESLSSSKFRNYFAICFRIIWVSILISVAILLSRPLIRIINGVSLGGRNDRYTIFIIGAFCLVLFLLVFSFYRLLVSAFARVDVFRDTLRDKYIRVVRHTDDDGRTSETYYYYLYFDQIFGCFKKVTQVSEKVYRKATIGKDYYLGIIHGSQSSKIFSVEEYQLTAAAEHARVPDAKALEQCTHWKWCAPEEKPVVNDGGVKRITPEQVAEDAYTYWSTEEKPSLVARFFKFLFLAVVAIVIFGAMPAAFFALGGLKGLLFSFGAMVISLAPFILLVVLLSRFASKNTRNRKKEILAGHYKVILDKIEATEEHDSANFSYRFIHEQMPVRLKSGHTVNLSRAKFNNVRPGDKLYIVYLETGSPYDDRSIVAVYQEKLGKLDFGFEVTWAS